MKQTRAPIIGSGTAGPAAEKLKASRTVVLEKCFRSETG
jgi:hypothetical protein